MTAKRKALWVLKIILFVILAIAFLVAVANYSCNLMLRSYINSFEPVAYPSDRLVPEKDGEYYAYTTDRDLKVMQLTDVHIGGGFWTFKEDKKTIYEVITMLQAEKPDLVVLGGDNVFCVPGPIYNGGFTFNNKMASTTVISIFEHEKVYFSTVFGNHDTESFDFFSREQIAKHYASDKWNYCIFAPTFRDPDAKTVPSESNQFILLKNSSGKIVKLVMLIDTNAYVDTSIQATIDWLYDTIHPVQVEWAANTIKELSAKAGLPSGSYLPTVCFMHIPTGEYWAALDDLLNGSKANDAKYISGDWADEGIFYGGMSNEGSAVSQDMLFETLADQMHCLEAMFCGHDHLNNAVVSFRGVQLSYGFSLDNIAYGGYMKTSGLQRGATVISLGENRLKIEHKNAYKDYGCSTTKFCNVQLNSYPIESQIVKLPKQ